MGGGLSRPLLIIQQAQPVCSREYQAGTTSLRPWQVHPGVPTTPACTWWNRPEEDPSSGKLESTHPSGTSVKYDQFFLGVESIMRVNAASLDIRDATTSTPGALNDLTTDLIMANNNRYILGKTEGNTTDDLQGSLKINHQLRRTCFESKPTDQLQKNQIYIERDLKIATGCHKMSSIDHLHTEAEMLKVREHSELLSAQYLARCLEPGNVCHPITTRATPERQMKETLYTRHRNTKSQ